MSTVRVTVENFVQIETERMFAFILKDTGGVNNWKHDRNLSALDHQPVIRQNRDTLYSVAVVDISGGATLTLPDAEGRYLSAMVINQDHYINDVLHAPGEHELTVNKHGTPFVLVGVRILVDPANPEDIKAVNVLQDQIAIRAASSNPFALTKIDEGSYQATRNALLELARGLPGFAHSFGKKADVDPIRHLLGTAAGWGGLPESEAFYLNVDRGLPVGEYALTVKDVPVDAFWSISLYNKEGYFEKNKRDLYSVNSITAEKNADGSVTVNFGTGDAAKPNYFPIAEGWNYTVRMYRPRPEVVNGRWTFPEPQPV